VSREGSRPRVHQEDWLSCKGKLGKVHGGDPRKFFPQQHMRSTVFTTPCKQREDRVVALSDGRYRRVVSGISRLRQQYGVKLEPGEG